MLENFELRLPRFELPDREAKTVEVYQELCDMYREFIESSTGTMIRDLFEQRYPSSGISELKKIDLVLWQIRS